MHNHVIAGDFGYLPVYSDEEGYAHKSEALEGLKEYVNMVVDSVDTCGWEHDWDWQCVQCSNPPKPDQYATIEDYWLATGVVRGIGTDGCKDTIQAIFNRRLASIDYAEITVCYEDCKSPRR